jgi:hypothetical protein
MRFLKGFFMRSVIMMSLVSFISFFSHASEIICMDASQKISLADFSTEPEHGNSNEADYIYDKLMECEQDVYFGKLCYKGSPEKAIQILTYISLNVFENAGVYSIQNSKKRADSSISYEIFDNTNNVVAESNFMKRCSQ